MVGSSIIHPPTERNSSYSTFSLYELCLDSQTSNDTTSSEDQAMISFAEARLPSFRKAAIKISIVHFRERSKTMLDSKP